MNVIFAMVNFIKVKLYFIIVIATIFVMLFLRYLYLVIYSIVKRK